MRARRHNQAPSLDQNLYSDRQTGRIIRHSVIGSDGGIYEASSFLHILQNGGMSLIHPDEPLMFAVRAPVIDNTINTCFGDHPTRNASYDIQAVMLQIQQHLYHQGDQRNVQAYDIRVHQADFVQGVQAAPAQIDQDLYHDRLTVAIIRHPVVGSDGGVYEASSYLQILQNAGMSLINRVHRLIAAVHVPAIENTIKSYFPDHADRNDAYDLQSVMAQIHRFHVQQRVLNHPLVPNLAVRPMDPAIGIAAALELAAVMSGTTGYLSGILGICLMIPGINLIPLMLYMGLVGGEEGIFDAAGHLFELVKKGMIVGGGVFLLAEAGLFAGRRLGVLPAHEPNRNRRLVMN